MMGSTRVPSRISFGAVALVCCLLSTSEAPAANSFFSNASIASTAERYRNGDHGGQCYVFVRRVLREATNGRIGPYAGRRGYNPGFKAAGGHEVKPEAAKRGDIIQVYPKGIPDDGRHNINSVVMPLHTAIITKPRGRRSFDVIDSNWKGSERVSRRDGWNPYAWARKKALLLFPWVR